MLTLSSLPPTCPADLRCLHVLDVETTPDWDAVAKHDELERYLAELLPDAVKADACVPAILSRRSWTAQSSGRRT